MKYPVLSGNEHLTFHADPLPQTTKDFWAWARSRLLADGPRGDLAEFIVNTALGCDTTNAKRGWGECDILYHGIRIEVKCSSVLQAWDRATPTKPVFTISKTLKCDVQEGENGYFYCGRDDQPPERRSELYVLCLFANPDRSTADPLSMDQWQFYVINTATINERCGDNRSLSLAKIKRWGIQPCDYGNLKSTIDRIVLTIS